MRARVDAAAYPEHNERMRNRSGDDVADRASLCDTYPWLRGSCLVKLFDIIEEDDRRTFGW